MQDDLIQDKLLERSRYDARAKELISKQLSQYNNCVFGSKEVQLLFREPYEYFESQIKSHAVPNISILEIGSGTGMHTGVLLETGAVVTATDISESSLEFLYSRHKKNEMLHTKIADMESLPFPDGSFNLISSAGSLSYGDNQLVMNEIYRVLKPGGVFICVDSLNHNPIYRLNRWFHYRRGERTISTLKRMPRLETIDGYAKLFGKIEVRFFGAISWLAPFLSRFFGDKNVASISKRVDGWLNVQRSAFKFVMVVQKEI